jgi:hypothetical protein
MNSGMPNHSAPLRASFQLSAFLIKKNRGIRKRKFIIKRCEESKENARRRADKRGR